MTLRNMEYQSYVLSLISVCNHFENKLISGVGRLSAGCSCATQLNIDGPLPRQADKRKINQCAMWGIYFNLHENVSETQTPLLPVLSERCSAVINSQHLPGVFPCGFTFDVLYISFGYPWHQPLMADLHYYSHLTREGTRTECKWEPR